MEIANEVLSLIPEESARFYKIIPLALKENVLEVAMVNPDDIKAREAIDFIARKNNLDSKIYLINERIFDVF